MVLRKNEKQAVNALKAQINSHYPLLNFRVYGSKARGDSSPDSDIDVMIEIPELNPSIQSDIYDMAFDVNLTYNCFISVVIFSRVEIEHGPLSESPIYKVIMKEGVVI
jgi:predicted nucleotidyltransferase